MLALAHVLDLLVHEFPSLRARRLALLPIAANALESFILRHVEPPFITKSSKLRAC